MNNLSNDENENQQGYEWNQPQQQQQHSLPGAGTRNVASDDDTTIRTTADPTTNEVIQLYAQITKSLAADVTAIQQCTDLAEVLGIVVGADGDDRNDDEKHDGKYSRDKKKDQSIVEQQLFELDRYIAGVEHKVSTLRRMVNEEQQAVVHFETDLRAEAQDQQAMLEVVLSTVARKEQHEAAAAAAAISAAATRKQAATQQPRRRPTTRRTSDEQDWSYYHRGVNDHHDPETQQQQQQHRYYDPNVFQSNPDNNSNNNDDMIETEFVQFDEEIKLPFEDNSFDLITSSLSLHWVNNLPGVMKEFNRCLKPDGAFIGAMLGGETLKELRSSLLLAEQEREGGVSSHVSPMAHVGDIGQLMQSAGFAIPTIDTDVLKIEYPNAFSLMEHLQGMGENNASISRRLNVSRDTFLAAAAAYQALYGDDEDVLDGGVPATFQIIYMIGWAPDPSQPQAKARGSAKLSLKDIDGAKAASVKGEEKEQNPMTTYTRTTLTKDDGDD